jgi:hypothetical protein
MAMPAFMKVAAVVVLALAAVVPAADGTPALRIRGKAWTETGGIMHSTDTLIRSVTQSIDLDGNRMQGIGGQFTAFADLGENLEAAIGFGGYQVYHTLGGKAAEINAMGGFRNYITEARLTWSPGAAGRAPFSLTIGNFAYSYNPHVHNLGLYLLRGSVYPGFLVSGFDNIHTDPTRGNVVGAQMRHSTGNFTQDIILSQERELPPTLDWSLAYIAKYRPFPALEVGAGVNFYHILPADKGLTTLSRDEFPTLYGQDIVTASDSTHHPYDFWYVEITPSGDTVRYTHQGVKLMGMFALDLKRWIGAGRMSPGDMVLYGEAAVIGVKDYGTVYDNVLERIPFMIGFNIPTGGLLDRLSVEGEWYGARYRMDYSKLGSFNSLYNRNFNPPIPDRQPPIPSPIPVSYRDYKVDANGVTRDGNGEDITGTDQDLYNVTGDNLKWSLLAEKSVVGRVRFTGQVANDHFVPRPSRTSGNAEGGGLTEAFNSLKDWYFMVRVGYYF